MLESLGGTWRAAGLAVGLLVGCGEGPASVTGTDDGSGSTGSPGSSGETTPAPSTGEAADSSTGGELPPALVPMEPPSVSVGSAAACDVTADGELRCWGKGDCGLFGDGTAHGQPPTVLGDPDTWRSVSLGPTHGCGIQVDGSLWCWGNGEGGRVGNGGLDDFPFTLNCRYDRVELEPSGTWAQVSAGQRHTCAVRQDGTLWCWGDNEFGQIGDGAVGSLYQRRVPVQSGNDDDWREIYAGRDHTCGLRSDDTIWCWGIGEALGDGVGASFSSLPVMVSGPSGWRSLARGSAAPHTCAIDDEGAVWCWGDPLLDPLGPGSRDGGLEPVRVELPAEAVQVSVGWFTSCAVLDGGAVWCWGSNDDRRLGLSEAVESSASPVEVHAGLVARDVRVGQGSICVVDDADVTWCWGRNRLGEVGDGSSGGDNTPRAVPAEVGVSVVAEPEGNWATIASGRSHGCGVRTDGSAWCWGTRFWGALGNGDSLPDCNLVDSVDCHFTVPVEVSGAVSWADILVGDRHTCGLDQDGALWCWGAEAIGQAGQTEPVRVPAAVLPDATWVSLATGGTHTCGVQSDGSLWCWGGGNVGQLGDGAQGPGHMLEVPAQLGEASDWARVVAGLSHTCGLRMGGALWCWGMNLDGEIGNGEDTSALDSEAWGVVEPHPIPGVWIDVAAGESHTCAIDDAGALWCWGSNADGAAGQDPEASPQVLDPARVGVDEGWVSLALGQNVSCATKNDGTLWCWGSRVDGKLGDGEIALQGGSSTPVQVGEHADWTLVRSQGPTVCGVRARGSAWCWGENDYAQQGNDTVFPSGTPKEVVQ